ncbi:uncharacterized protein LOC125302497 [Alosa alosa]|uniref:uncharacterized protein LOC125302497 n=1 Tax=Alosa alosa TaxID=278164 RepID=UPI0020150A97|nr:uncharacterized protein LOC125302497 [Alosa alosa]
MKEECKKVHPNITILKDKMKRTTHERMEFIQSHSTRESLLEFPALNQIFSEIEERYKVDLDKMLLHGLGRAAGKIIEQVSKKKQGTNILSEYEMALGEACEETHKGLKICAAALMLPHLFNENPDKLYVIDKVPRAPTPLLVVDGNPFGDCSITLTMDGVSIAHPDDITMGIAALLGTYFIFGVKYAQNIKKTLAFLQIASGITSQEKINPTVVRMANALL